MWEDCERPVEQVYFATEEEFAEGLSCNPHAFLVGCAIPAMHYGESRLSIEAEICPELRQGLITAMSWLRHWYYGPDRELVRIEAKTQARPPRPHIPARAGFFFSGGVDAFALLRTNRLNFPPGHPGSIKDGLLVYGLELDDLEAFSYVRESLSKAAKDLGITLIPVYTNVYLNYREEDARQGFSFWRDKFASAPLSAVAHVFAKRLTVVSIAASEDIHTLSLVNQKTLQPYGTHPLLDPNYSSYNLQIRHQGVTSPRVEKARLVADWDVALQNLRVCNQFKLYRSGHLNCGRCEKCIRTMLVLLALGILNCTRAFANNDLSANMVLEAVKSMPDFMVQAEYEELMATLAKKNREDLALAIKRVIARSHRQRWKMRMAGLDERCLGGRLRRFKQWVTS